VLNIDTEFTDTQGQAIEYLFDKKLQKILFGGAAGGGKSWVGCSWLILLCVLNIQRLDILWAGQS
jgi:hypothetical protein